VINNEVVLFDSLWLIRIGSSKRSSIGVNIGVVFARLCASRASFTFSSDWRYSGEGPELVDNIFENSGGDIAFEGRFSSIRSFSIAVFCDVAMIAVENEVAVVMVLAVIAPFEISGT
jgi:hypothetical protein